jgi:hypothetical protein
MNTSGLNFINVLRTAFTHAQKSQSSCQYLFTLLGSTGAKAARRTMMKLTPGFPSRPIYYQGIHIVVTKTLN